MWQRPVPERRRSVPLDRDLIVAAAIGLADAAHGDCFGGRRTAAGEPFCAVYSRDSLLSLNRPSHHVNHHMW
jgi:hypothetical protein